MRFTLPANSASKLGRTYLLSPQIRRLRNSAALPLAKRSRVRTRSCVLSFTVSTVWNGSAMRTGATRLSSRYLPSQTSSVTDVDATTYGQGGNEDWTRTKTGMRPPACPSYVAHLAQLRGQLVPALARPAQRRLRVAARNGVPSDSRSGTQP